jgi:ComF family protein
MSYLPELIDDFISLLFPRLCYACGNHLLRNEKLICTECFVLMPRTNYHLEKNNPAEQLFWGRCKIEKVSAFSFYNRDSRIRQLIHNLKYKGVKDIGLELGKIYGLSLIRSDFLHGIDIIIPVPLHPSKQRIRGFNQSDLISDGVAEVTGIPVDKTLLTRSLKTETQTRRSRYDRWINVEGIFTVTSKEDVKGKHILLIDDVITTGSTIESCANELLSIENVKVSVAALAVAVV